MCPEWYPKLTEKDEGNRFFIRSSRTVYLHHICMFRKFHEVIARDQ